MIIPVSSLPPRRLYHNRTFWSFDLAVNPDPIDPPHTVPSHGPGDPFADFLCKYVSLSSQLEADRFVQSVWGVRTYPF